MSDPVSPRQPSSLEDQKHLKLHDSEAEAFQRYLVNRLLADENKRRIQAQKFLEVYAKHDASRWPVSGSEGSSFRAEKDQTYDAMLELRREATRAEEREQLQATMAYKRECLEYARLGQREQMILDKITRNEANSSEVLTDYLWFKFQWLGKRLDSELKRAFGFESFDRVQSSLDKQVILGFSSSRAKEMAGKALNLGHRDPFRERFELEREQVRSRKAQIEATQQQMLMNSLID